ncbi:hypothetical protein BDN71DRAFT_1451535 [Pleurotus eryngii]|uniref:Uncharacterized protein n=1 Tax=Pleurotus eryngii TaxID=5323 RepID=A0A9P5ZRP2_PLEER|nr:hypothetical protein BDN71DRAFT_1451535 [Pleurotus eryngii]
MVQVFRSRVLGRCYVAVKLWGLDATMFCRIAGASYPIINARPSVSWIAGLAVAARERCLTEPDGSGRCSNTQMPRDSVEDLVDIAHTTHDTKKHHGPAPYETQACMPSLALRRRT